MTKQTSLRHHLGRSLGKGSLWGGLVLAGALALSPNFHAGPTDVNVRPAVTAPVDAQADAAAKLTASHDCWVYDHPEGVIPGHAVVDTGHGPRYASSTVGFAIWLGADSTPNSGDEKQGTVYAFCP